MPSDTKPCPFCAEQILPDAIKCKHCGSMLTQAKAPVVIEKTSKQLKSQMLLCVFLAIFGFVMLMIVGPQHNEGLNMVLSLLVLGGIVGLIVTKVQAWWNHG